MLDPGLGIYDELARRVANVVRSALDVTRGPAIRTPDVVSRMGPIGARAVKMPSPSLRHSRRAGPSP